MPHGRHMSGLVLASAEYAQQLAACHFLGLVYAKFVDLIVHRFDLLDELLWRQTSKL